MHTRISAAGRDASCRIPWRRLVSHGHRVIHGFCGSEAVGELSVGDLHLNLDQE